MFLVSKALNLVPLDRRKKMIIRDDEFEQK
jgi:hypothetical protein